MKRYAAAWLLAAAGAGAQTLTVHPPRSVTAGTAFSIGTEGDGKGTLLVIGPGGVLRRELTLGGAAAFAAADLYNAGRYLCVLQSGSVSATAVLDVVPAPQPKSISFLARPSRLPVSVHGGISGTAYIFDTYGNLMPASLPVSFELSASSGPAQVRTAASRAGVAWTTMDSSPREGRAVFRAQVSGITSTRVIDEVPGDPCSLNMSARPDGKKVALETAPVRDCGGNSVPDGTVVTFTETYNGLQSTVDAPLKKGVARAEMPSVSGAHFSVASGVVAGNEIRWGGGR